MQAVWPEMEVSKVPAKIGEGMTEYLEFLETRRIRSRATAGAAK